MIRLTRLIVMLIIFIISKTTVYSQQKPDSIRLVNEDLKMILFPELEFESHFVCAQHGHLLTTEM